MADNYVVRDGNGDPLTKAGKDIGSGVQADKIHVPDGHDEAVGAKADAAASSDAGAFGLIALVKRGLQSLTAVLAKLPALSSGRVPVEIDPIAEVQVSVVGGTLILDEGDHAVGRVGGHAARVPGAASFARPADTTAYAVGDLVANSTTAGGVTAVELQFARAAGGTALAYKVRLRKSSTDLPGASYRVHLYQLAPAFSNGDNGAWMTNSTSEYLGSFDVTMDRAFTTGASGYGLPSDGSGYVFLQADLGGSSLSSVFACVEARAVRTPASGESYVVELFVLQN